MNSRSRVVSGLSACALTVLVSACQGGAGDAVAEADVFEPGQLEQPIVGGDTDREHTGVLAIAAITPDSEALCSGTLIAPNLVLTARHCVVPVENEVVTCGTSTFADPYTPGTMWVSPAARVSGADLFPVREIAVPDDDGSLCGGDIALLILDGQFSDRVPTIAPRLNAPAVQGEAFTAVGYGTALEEGGAGIRRSAESIEVLCGAEQCGAPDVLTNTEFLGEQAVCEGDSGGPALDQDGEVIGVASRTGEDCTWAIYSAVSPWSDWIVDVATHAGSLGDYDAPAWLVAANTDAQSSDGPLEIPGVADLGNVPTPGTSGDGTVEAPSGPALGDMGAAVPSASRGDSGCSLGTSAPIPSKTGAVWLVAAGLGLFGRSRRRKSC